MPKLPVIPQPLNRCSPSWAEKLLNRLNLFSHLETKGLTDSKAFILVPKGQNGLQDRFGSANLLQN
jgi:hypothetical protein